MLHEVVQNRIVDERHWLWHQEVYVLHLTRFLLGEAEEYSDLLETVQ